MSKSKTIGEEIDDYLKKYTEGDEATRSIMKTSAVLQAFKWEQVCIGIEKMESD